MPDEDRTLSPYTGYTRAHWEAAADSLLAAVAPYATENGALYHLPGAHTSWSGRLSDGLEGYARTLLLAAFRRDEKALERYADGLAAGTAGVWPRVEDRSQPLVEAASIALALRLTRPLLWDRLDDGVRQRAAAWLGDALTAEPWACNWELFPVTVGGFLAEVGHEPEASRAAIERGLERIEEWYVGDGWYTDGPGRAFDYYNGWAMHLYPVLHAWLADDTRLLDLYGGRLSRHLIDYARLFGGDGAPMRQGRSLTYRFATTAPLWLGALTGRTPLSPGETRRLASGALRHFLDRGAVDERGLITLGWHGPDETVLQGYSGPASPYWASKAFVGLLLPPDHEVWTAREEPGPTDRADAVTPVGPPNWLLQTTTSDGLVRLHNHGSEDVRYDPHYTRLGYSTATAPSTSYDNSVIVGDDPSRTDIEPLGAGDGWVASRHTAGGGARVVNLVVARGAVEVRAHLVAGAAQGTPVRVTGWPEDDGVHAELLAAHNLLDSAGVTGPGATLFVALARLTGEPDPLPLTESVSVKVEGEEGQGEYDVRVSWPSGPSTCFRFRASDGRPSVSSWSVKPR
ncbi:MULTISPECIES: DUF2264 domain-containing protein [unclassified Streptomyces]|uniref:DUF2264 domain-containing protein n=1 Tax=unclassified Streptomyces TaxID=2593676 RepID=UPI001163CD1A|nr:MULTISPECIES: DUF2264 domain-containing protein [unclassified Streptomyces]NMI61775.1 DUF2264 domain-containing protein [Streptomyces sp. RLA2-12]QDN60848.1 DUF2264 domain-containing protein [Streptomyces sp. S1D4-20]QDN70902.1 DUF2264 domain-containing protein [Streptomyces sp. S1D4-14]QDO53358.1 DUF2264 domain-containing protein [Streptomyces sp. RLB3-5]QDO63603.1 DUF2264 domain-containing protein [Streptomyces sp. RLB1-8]